MKIVTPPLVVGELDGFQNDAFQRRFFGEALLNLVKRSNDELVISLDGRWGEGKTTFVKMWQGLLGSSGIPSIYIDAFQTDYSEDAFIVIASSITSYIEAHSENNENNSEFKEKAKKLGVHLLSWTAKIAIKAATLGVVDEADVDALKSIKDDISTGASSLIENYVKERLESHVKDVETVRSFKNELSSLPSKIKNNKSDRLVIIIDELDRCRPSFAVEVLEKIKHLFSVEKIVFVLVMHKEQLEEAIRCVYGNNIDAHTYLQKFINVEASIPKNTEDNFKGDLKVYSKRLLELHELQTRGGDGEITECVSLLAQNFNLSLRQLEKVFTNLSIIYGVLEENHLRLVPIIVFISVIKVIKPQIFNKLLLRKISYTEFLEELDMNGADQSVENNRKLSYMMSWMKYGLLNESAFNQLDANDLLKNMGGEIFRYNVSREEIIPVFSRKLSMFSINQ